MESPIAGRDSTNVEPQKAEVDEPQTCTDRRLSNARGTITMVIRGGTLGFSKTAKLRGRRAAPDTLQEDSKHKYVACHIEITLTQDQTSICCGVPGIFSVTSPQS
jgi:hypothetical protein